jgi:hypothetical protein
METNETESTSKAFSAEYVKELREEAKSYRLQMEEARTAAKSYEQAAHQAQEAATKAAQEAEAKIAEHVQNLETSRYEADLKMEAVKAGIRDTDFLKLLTLDTSKSAAEAIAEFQASKPFCFNAAVTTTVPTAQEPARATTERKDVRHMTPQERQADMARLLGK